MILLARGNHSHLCVIIISYAITPMDYTTSWHCTHVYELSRLIYVLCSCLRPLMLYMLLVWPSLSHHYHSWVTLLPSPLKCILSYFRSVWRRHHRCLSKHNDFSKKKSKSKIKIPFWNPISRPHLLRKNTNNLKSYTWILVILSCTTCYLCTSLLYVLPCVLTIYVAP